MWLILTILDHGDGHGNGQKHEKKLRDHKPFLKLGNAQENANTANDNDNVDRIHGPHNHSNKENSTGQMNMRGVYLHFMADAIGSVFVVVSAMVCVQI